LRGFVGYFKNNNILTNILSFFRKIIKWFLYFILSPKIISDLKAESESLRLALLKNEIEIACLNMAVELQTERTKNGPVAPAAQKAVKLVNVDSNKGAGNLDMLYTQFEDEFRGSEEEILIRQSAYLKYFKGLVPAQAKVLDIGCGRGEWLQIMSKEGLRAAGVDTNSLMVRECKVKGFDVVEMDGLEFLLDKPENFYDAITGFHIVEHIPPEMLLKLFSEVYRTLKPSGIAIFETPNPENILVGSCTFYSDFTHLRPIPPQTLEFLLKKRGFTGTEIVRISPLAFANSAGNEKLKNIVDRFNIGQDYAVIARKPGVKK